MTTRVGSGGVATRKTPPRTPSRPARLPGEERREHFLDVATQLITDQSVDSVTMELGREGHSIDLVIHPVILVRRDEGGRLIEMMLVADRIERRLREMGHVLRDVEVNRIARHAVHEDEDDERDTEERQDAVEESANDVGDHQV